jgi:hypothetical protein
MRLTADIVREVSTESDRAEAQPAIHAAAKQAKAYRAQRYRATRCPPPGERICALCGRKRNVEVGHVDGHEENGAPQNLIWTCRSCNVRCAHTLKRAGLGRLTHQYNPAKSEGAETLGQWMNPVMSIKGDSGGTMSVSDAVSLIHATPPEQRSRFAREIWDRRRRPGSGGTVPF